jgi:hypothetical protein
MKTPRAHRFPGNTSAEVYAFSQTMDEIRDGDVLIVPDEGVVGILVQAWPVAVSAHAGAFHETAPGWSWDAVQTVIGGPTKSYRPSFDLAAAEFPAAMESVA